MKKNLITSVLMTIVTTILLGILYPLLITVIAHAILPRQADGELIYASNGTVIGSHLIGQPFVGPGYFHSRPSAAGAAGYDATASGGSNLGPTNAQLIARVNGSVASLQSENLRSGDASKPVPVDLVTASGSGLDPDITPAAAEFQTHRVASERRASESDIVQLVREHTENRQFGLFGEPRVNVLDLNLALDAKYGKLK
jgi:potassium-transporting ATPase KdpC subunit